MFKQYLLLTWRNIKRHKIYAFLNITGLAIGMACFILIMLWVHHETSYDKHNEHYENLYRLGLDIKMGDTEGKGSSTSGLMGPALVEDYPEVLNMARFYKGINKLVSWVEGDVHHTEDRVYYADSTIFDLFTIPVITGDPSENLSRPYTLFITESTARRYFGNESAIGKILNYDGHWDYEIVGVIEDAPLTSHWQYDFITSSDAVGSFRNAYWLNDNLTTYILLKEGTDWKDFEKKLIDFRNRHVGPIVEQEIGMGFEEWENTGNRYRYILDPVKNIYLQPRTTESDGPRGSMTYVIVFMIVAIFILLIACVNFMNLTTARAATRAKEIGLRKVVGSYRLQIFRQLLFESIVYSFLSMVLALIIIEIVLPYFSHLSSIPLEHYFNQLSIIPFSLLIVLLVGFISGIYSALVISSFKVIIVLKGNILQKGKKSWLRNGLVLFQFAISIMIIICTFVISHQLHYIQNKELGFHKEQTFVIKRVYSLWDKLGTFKEEVGKFPGVVAASITSHIPGTGSSGNTLQKEGAGPQDMVHFRQISGDYEYLEAMGIQLKEGRYYTRDFLGDSAACVINESAVKNLGLDKPIGTKLYYVAESEYRTVIGVVGDYHFNSLRQEIPNILLLPPFSHYSHFMVVRAKTGTIQQTIDQIKNLWEELAVNQPFQYFFLDEHFENLHQTEIRSGMLFKIFSFLAIVIACLGLYGLATFTAQQKIREIGIRKVLGASVSNITFRLFNQFTRWVLIANVIAWPIAWFVMNKWLQNFAYRINVGVSSFILTMVITLLISLLTVSFQTIRAAHTNPAEVIKYE
ncbi:MAG: ABC transporter permease [Candidatus Cloacimonetes bacterium]|nr:ABC transporter permease [Candidatus Cloacimonadota bacterium]